jgi:hypothetical protein
MVATAANLQEISPNTEEEGRGAPSEAVTAVTAVTLDTRNNPIDMQASIPTTGDIQPRSETIRNAGEIYWSGTNWYCRQCKLNGDKFYMEGHICKGYAPM